MNQRFAVFASGNGSNLQALIDAVKSSQIRAELALVFSDQPQAYALERAQKAGIAVLHLSPKNYPDRESFERDIVSHLRQSRIDFIVLAGYMRLLTAYLIGEYPHKILNIHPSLLPAFKGAHGIKDAWSYGVKVTGVTVHFVDEQTDHGPIIAQASVTVDPGETFESLEAKIHAVEHNVYPRAVALMADNRLIIRDRKVEISS